MEKKGQLNNILKVAEKSFAQSGYRGVSLQGIAESAGVSKSLIFYYFKNKRKLFEELIKKSVEIILKKLNEVAGSNKKPAEKIEAFIQTFFEILLKEKALIQLLARETSNPESPIASLVIKQSRKIIDSLASIIEEGVQEGSFRPLNPRTAAISLFGMLTTYVAAINVFGRQLSSSELKNFSKEELSRINTEIFLKGIAK
jgi:AcrR family transcriptional regulator